MKINKERAYTSIYFDLETSQITNNRNGFFMVPYLIGACNEEKEFVWFTKVKDFIDYLFNIDKPIYLYGYNVSYDLTILIPYLHRFPLEEYRFRFSKLQFNEEKEFVRGYFSIVKGLKSKSVTVFDLWMFLKNKKLADWALEIYKDDVTKHKLEIDYRKLNVEIDEKNGVINYQNPDTFIKKTAKLVDELNYLKNDVLILPEINLRQRLIKGQASKLVLNYVDKKVFRKRTVGSVSKYLLDLIYRKNSFTFYNYRLPIDQMFLNCKIDNFSVSEMDNSYIGGLTFQNKFYVQYFGDIYKIDINSLYPYIETKFPIPYGPFYDLEQMSLVDGEKVIWVRIKFDTYLVNDDYQFLSSRLIPFRFDKKIVWLVKDFFVLLKEIGNFVNLQIINQVFQRANFLNGDLYHKILYPLKNSTDVVKRTAVKLLLNSSYGKKAEKTYSSDFHYVNGYLQEKPAFNQPKSKFSGIFVVNMARYYFLKEIKKVVDKKGLILYGDTDSLILNKHPSYYNLNIHQTVMGAWKLEGKTKRNGLYLPYQEVYFLKNKLKKYYLYHPDQRHSSLIFSGCPLSFFKNLDHLTLKKLFNNDFNVQIINCKTATKTNDYGQKLIENINFETNNQLPVSHYLENGELKNV